MSIYGHAVLTWHWYQLLSHIVATGIHIYILKKIHCGSRKLV